MRRVCRVLMVAALVAACGGEEVVQHPAPLPGQTPFRYPLALWDEGVEAEAVLMVRVTPLGGVDSAYVDRSSGHPAIDSAAVAGVMEMRFRPGRRGEDRVAMWARLPVRFARDGGAGAELEVLP